LVEVDQSREEEMEGLADEGGKRWGEDHKQKEVHWQMMENMIESG